MNDDDDDARCHKIKNDTIITMQLSLLMTLPLGQQVGIGFESTFYCLFSRTRSKKASTDINCDRAHKLNLGFESTFEWLIDWIELFESE